MELEITLNNIFLPRPILGIELFSEPTYLFVGIPAERIEGVVDVRILSKVGEILAECRSERPTGIPEEMSKTWRHEDRLRVCKGLLQQSRKMFPHLEFGYWRQIAQSISMQPLRVDNDSDGSSLYVKLSWKQVIDPGLNKLLLRFVSDMENGYKGEQILGLSEGGNLHLFSRLLAQLQYNDEALVLMDVGNIGCIPILIRIPRIHIANETKAARINRLFDQRNKNFAVLRGYAQSLLGGAKSMDAAGRDGQKQVDGEVIGVRGGYLVGAITRLSGNGGSCVLEILIDGIICGDVDVMASSDTCPREFTWQIPDQYLSGVTHEVIIRTADTLEVLAGCPVFLGKSNYDGEYGLEHTGDICGWVRERCMMASAPELQLLIDGPMGSRESVQHIPQDDLSLRWDRHSRTLSFRIRAPEKLFDTHAYEVSLGARRDKYCPWRVIKPVLKIQATFKGHYDKRTPREISGWIENELCPDRPVCLDIYLNNEHTARVLANKPYQAEDGRIINKGFSYRAPEYFSQELTLKMAVCLVNGDAQSSSSMIQPGYVSVIKGLSHISSLLNVSESAVPLMGMSMLDNGTAIWLRREFIPGLIKDIRTTRSLPDKSNSMIEVGATTSRRSLNSKPLDVVIPVHGGRDAMNRCLTSVICSKNEVTFQLIVIDDASPDPTVPMELKALAEQQGFIFLENRSNLGFPVTANKGMNVHPDRDIILLNSDTVVADGWLDRLQRAAYSADNIGTVTPFSNNASICSFPNVCKKNRLPSGLNISETSRLFAHLNDGITVEIPTAVGFCMYIRRSLLNEVGYFDESRWGKGYAEENELCIRASDLGWRHVIACDVYVEHEGSVSFGSESDERIKANLSKLNALYPEYLAHVKGFIAQDPLRFARERVIKHLIKSHSNKYILYVYHGLGGGVERHVHDLAAALSAQQVAVLELISLSQKTWVLKAHELPYCVTYDAGSLEQLIADLKVFGVWHIHYHQTMHFPRKIWDLPDQLGVCYDFTLHDYLTICPRINMMDETGQYCGEAQLDPDKCDRCIRINGLDHDLEGKYLEFGGKVRDWRQCYQTVLSKARMVFAPSQDTASRVSRHFALNNLTIKPHISPVNIPIRPTVSHVQQKGVVAVIGAIGVHKGFNILLSCIKNAIKEDLHIRYVIIGYTADDKTIEQFPNVHLTGEYHIENLPVLISEAGADIALFLSPWPETYCYTLSEALANGLYPIAFDIGAIAERLKALGYGKLIPLTDNPDTINGAIMDVIRQRKRRPPRLRSEVLGDLLSQYYMMNKNIMSNLNEVSDNLVKFASRIAT